MTQPQHMVALARANEVRLGQRALLRAMAAHEKSIGGALVDERAAGLTVYRLLMAQYNWGRGRALYALTRAGRILWGAEGPPLGEARLVGDLTDRERRALAEACRGEGSTAA